MIKYFLLLFIVLLFVWLVKNKIQVKWKTFFEKGFKKEKNIYGVYCYCGKQGSSKTGNVITYLYENRDKVIFANLTSIDEENIPYTYIRDINDLLELRKEHDCIIFYDEIFTVISRESKLPESTKRAVLDFLSQMRKRRIVFITTCQEWRLLPLYFRLYVRYQVNCSMFNIPFFGAISIKNVIDGDHIKWDEQEQDFVGELVHNIVQHCVKKVYDMYDTYEQIGKFASSTFNHVDKLASCSRPEDAEQEIAESDEINTDIDFNFWNLVKKGEDIYESEEKK